MQQRVQERKQTHKESHTSPSLCSPLFFSSHHRILKYSKTKNAFKFLEKYSKKKARNKETKKNANTKHEQARDCEDLRDKQRQRPWNLKMQKKIRRRCRSNEPNGGVMEGRWREILKTRKQKKNLPQQKKIGKNNRKNKKITATIITTRRRTTTTATT